MKITATLSEFYQGHLIFRNIIDDEQLYCSNNLQINQTYVGKTFTLNAFQRNYAREYIKNVHGEYKLLFFQHFEDEIELYFLNKKSSEIISTSIIPHEFNDLIIGSSYDINNLRKIYRARLVLPGIDINSTDIYTKVLVSNHIYQDKYAGIMNHDSKNAEPIVIKVTGDPIKFIGNSYYFYLQRKILIRQANLGNELITTSSNFYKLNFIENNILYVKDINKDSPTNTDNFAIVSPFDISSNNIGLNISFVDYPYYYVNPSVIRISDDTNDEQLISIYSQRSLYNDDAFYTLIFKNKNDELYSIILEKKYNLDNHNLYVNLEIEFCLILNLQGCKISYFYLIKI